jgi:hypothetical protein
LEGFSYSNIPRGTGCHKGGRWNELWRIEGERKLRGDGMMRDCLIIFDDQTWYFKRLFKICIHKLNTKWISSKAWNIALVFIKCI